MIPKIIHYCWFGRGPMPPLALICIESWKRKLPEYELKLWNEENFNLDINPYVAEAYKAKKYAFVTDYVRLWALYNYGGVYLDTDVEILRSIDDFLELPAFSGFEDENRIPTGIMASEQGGVWVKEQLDYYTDRHIIKNDGTMDLTTNVEIIGTIMERDGFVMKNGYQNHKDKIHIYPKEYFCPKYNTGKIDITKNTYCIHHFAGSWLPWPAKIKVKIYKFIITNRFSAYIYNNTYKRIKK